MSRQIVSLNRYLSDPSNLQRPSPNISISDLTPSPIPSYTNTSPRMDSDDNSTHIHTVFIPFHNLTTPILKLQMKPRIPSPARRLFRNPPSVHSTPQLPMNLPQPLPPTPKQPQYSPQ